MDEPIKMIEELNANMESLDKGTTSIL